MSEEENKTEQHESKDFRAGHRERLCAKFLESGPDSFRDDELTELLLMFAIPRMDVKPIAKRLHEKFQTYASLLDARPEELMQIKGVKEKTTILIRLIRATCDRYLLQTAKTQRYPKSFDTPNKFADYARMHLGNQESESILVFYLNPQLRLQTQEILSFGDNSGVGINVRAIAKSAIRNNAEFVVLCHNHPSGAVEPSRQDDEATMLIRDALEAVDVKLLDHLIVSNVSFYSYRRHNLDSGRPRNCLTVLREDDGEIS